MRSWLEQQTVQRTQIIAGLLGIATSVGLVAERAPDSVVAVGGNPQVLIRQYEIWRNSKPEVLVIELQPSVLRSARPTTAHGVARFNLADGKVTVEIDNAPEESLEAWLIDRTGTSQSPSASPRRIGGFSREEHGSESVLQATLDPGGSANVKLDTITVITAGQNPHEDELLSGSLGLFQKLYLAELDRDSEPGSTSSTQGFRSSITLDEDESVASILTGMASAGANIFNNFTFDGNGRTCSTCHVPTNNYTLDPEYIAELDPSNPLFVADPASPAANPNLLPDEKNNNRRFEVPELMRSRALVLSNADGYPDPSDPYDRFVMRAVPSLNGLSDTRFVRRCSNNSGLCSVDDDCPPPGCVEGSCTFVGGQCTSDTDCPPSTCLGPVPECGKERLGWSGDVATLLNDWNVVAPLNQDCSYTGRLPDMVRGAIDQHLTNSLARVPGVDYREPTPEEVDELVAFLLSLGRTGGLASSLGSYLFVDDADLNAGKEHFEQGDTSNITCQRCHYEGGAIENTDYTNANYHIGVERFLQARMPPVQESCNTAPYGSESCWPPDGGFGRDACKVTGNQTPLIECIAPGGHPCEEDEACATLPPPSGSPYVQGTSYGGITEHRERHSWVPDVPGPGGEYMFEKILDPDSRLDGSMGDLTFNTPSIIEAADTPPYFHNNAVSTLEMAINYYGRSEFRQAQGVMLFTVDRPEDRCVAGTCSASLQACMTDVDCWADCDGPCGAEFEFLVMDSGAFSTDPAQRQPDGSLACDDPNDPRECCDDQSMIGCYYERRQVQHQLARYLRVLNSFDNIVNAADRELEAAILAGTSDQFVAWANLASANIEDTATVLGSGAMTKRYVCDDVDLTPCSCTAKPVYSCTSCGEEGTCGLFYEDAISHLGLALTELGSAISDAEAANLTEACAHAATACSAIEDALKAFIVPDESFVMKCSQPGC